ncbi:MAG TPA: glycosyltransferase 87 family protein [Candidatus Dormibacteraeota bacterium]
MRLVHGTLPYRDFVFVQPPGLALLAAPFAWLSEAIGTRDGLAVLRACTPLLAAANALLAVRIVRPLGTAAMIAAGAVAALFPAELYALRAGLLEPVVDLLCLAGLALLFRTGAWPVSRRVIVLAGVLFGLAGAVKLTAIVPAAAVLLLAATRPRQRLLPFAAGAAAGFLLPALPFLIEAPDAFYRDVFVAQFGRAAGGHAAFYPQYPAVLVPVLAPAAALVVSRLRKAALPAAAAVSLYLLVTQLTSIASLSTQDVARAVDSVVPAGACAISDKPRLLVTSDRFGCTPMTDPYGTMLALGTRDPVWAATFTRADYLVTDTPIERWYIAPDPPLEAYVARHFSLQRSGGLLFYVRLASESKP